VLKIVYAHLGNVVECRVLSPVNDLTLLLSYVFLELASRATIEGVRLAAYCCLIFELLRLFSSLEVASVRGSL
jgi:hypothetical protein